MTPFSKNEAAEPKAKAALIDFLRSNGCIPRKSAVATEFNINRYANRADVVLANDDGLHFFEIKTERDTLHRLERQIEAYSLHANFVTVALTKKHVDVAYPLLPEHVGLLQLPCPFFGNEVKLLRAAKPSPSYDAVAMLSLLPADAINSRLLQSSRNRRRADLVREAAALPTEAIRAATLAFVIDRYRLTTAALLKATKNRTIRSADLVHLKKWDRSNRKPTEATGVAPPMTTAAIDAEIYQYVGKSFGPVPAEITQLLGLTQNLI
ncbi:sce7726 family protein [Sphingomonas sp. Leaf23]|uniref:sce7726 family protein n=1 Tax=Sphingomonas sp. Leaf23 TaxID=1735689 RepID=UPI000A804EF4|nr:sce7726 family protein [Sphingomonas sp. Leaf23]